VPVYVVRVVYDDLSVEKYFPAIDTKDAREQMQRYMAEHFPKRSWEKARIQARLGESEKAKLDLERGGSLT
jgi:hypothetical protein